MAAQHLREPTSQRAQVVGVITILALLVRVPNPRIDAGGGGISWWPLLALLVIFVVAAVSTAAVWRRRRNRN